MSSTSAQAAFFGGQLPDYRAMAETTVVDLGKVICSIVPKCVETR